MSEIEQTLDTVSESQYMEFLYVVVKEYYSRSKSEKLDTELRIVYWKEEWGSNYPEQFVVYGRRPDSKKKGDYVPYRLRFSTREQVEQFAQTIIVSSENHVVIELHQFSGLNNDSDDLYNIDWENTQEDSTTELVAFEIESRLQANGDIVLNYIPTLHNVLTILENGEAV
jgi:hypothetical protein